MALSTAVDREGRNVPFFVDYYEYHSIATENFSPTENASADTQQVGVFKDKGFLVRPNADGAFYGITLYDYKENNNSLTGLVPQQFLGVANQWIECRLIKVFSPVNATYSTVATAINIGVTI